MAVGGGSAIDTAKAVNLLTSNEGELMDYVNAPVGKARNPEQPLKPLVAVPTTTGTGAESTTICVLDVLVAEGEDRHLPRPAPADPGRGRPDAHHDPAGRRHRRGRAWTSSATRSRATPRARTRRTTASSRSSGCPTAARTRSRTCGRRRRCRCSRRRSAGRCTTVTTSTPAGEMAMAATFAGLGFGNAGRAHPARQRLPDRRTGPRLPPRRLPRRRADGAARDGGLADRARGVPVHLRVRARTPPARCIAAGAGQHVRRRPRRSSPGC